MSEQPESWSNLNDKLLFSCIRLTLGLTVNKRDGEYIINYRKSDPRYKPETVDGGSAYFTNDRTDALDTAYAMHRHPINVP